MAGAYRRRGRIARGAGVAIVLLVALATLGACVPALPVVGLLGAAMLSWFGAWTAIVSLVAAVTCVRRWQRRTDGRLPVLAIIAVAAAAGSIVILAAQWRAGRAAGLAIDPVRALWVGPVPHASAAPEVTRYARYDRESLPIQLIRPPRAARRPAPVLVYIHGGGWTGGVYWMRNHDLRWFADRGLLVVSVEYPLSGAGRHLWNVDEGAIGCALAWVRANAARYGGDARRVALIGESAGGNLAIDVAYRARAGTLAPACPGALPAVSAVVADYPAVDPADMVDAGTSPSGPIAYAGGTPAQVPDRYRAISSFTHVSRAAPPTLLIVGEADRIVAPGTTYRFARAARAVGVPVELIRVPFGGHVFDFMAGSIPNQIFRQATMRFLARHGVGPA